MSEGGTVKESPAPAAGEGSVKQEDSVYSRWANGAKKKTPSGPAEDDLVYFMITCPITNARSLFYIPTPVKPPPPRRR